MAALLLLGLHALARFVVETQLRHEAERKLDALTRGEPLWRWSLRQPRDLVAGRPFGHATANGTARGLRVVSRDGQPFELGLPVMTPLDLAHWPRLRVTMSPNDQAGELWLVVQAQPNEAACSAAAAAIPAHSEGIVIDLRHLAWRRDDGGACTPPSVVAYMLRLQFRIPAGSELELRDAALLTAEPLSSQRAAIATITSVNDLDQLASAGRPMPAAPLLLLPRTASTETWLALRDRILARWPGAVVTPAGDPLVATTQAATPPWLGWAIAAAYAVMLLQAGLRRTHPAWEFALLIAGPLWLIAGMQWGLHAFPPAAAAFVAALTWAAWRERKDRLSDWQWFSRAPWVWLAPLALIPVAWGLGAGLGHGWAAPNGRQALLYVAWASLQQWLMLAVVLRHLERWWGGTALPILATATLFALLHTPNGMLMQLCFLAELWWAWCFLRSRRLLPIALAHAGCALLVEAGLTGGLLRSLEVSARFLL